MYARPGRPIKACETCRTQKARCSGDRPICTRCSRLRRSCNYNSETLEMPKTLQPQQVPDLANPSLQPPYTTAPRVGHSQSRHAGQVSNFAYCPPSVHLTSPVEERYHGIPSSLLLDLVEVYYAHVGNASLVLHKRSFLEQLEAGIACPHVVISVCAVASNFYRDRDNNATLKEQGFMTEWAERAGKLVFQEVENVNEDNLVTFWNLFFFWHSQGSWRKSYIYRGNAAQVAHVLGLGIERPGMMDSVNSELRRRRFWACYLMHCYASEPFSQPEPGGNIRKLSLPWREEDFEIGVLTHRRVCLESDQTNGGIYCELVHAWTLWSSVSSLIRGLESNAGEIAAIHILDDRISDWWKKLPPCLQLIPSRISEVPHEILPNLLHLHIIYHQCLCALHSSIVPLFSWSGGNDNRSSARQLSAQIAFENACAASALIHAALSEFPKPGRIPSFVAYAAYCGCAIQIPFIWCSNPTVRARARANVRANVKMIHILAEYWKFCSLLEVRVHCLLRVYKRNQILIEDEPRYMDPNKLAHFKINAPRARESILGHIQTLWTIGDGYAKPGDENTDLGIEEECEPQAVGPDLNNRAGSTTGHPQTQDDSSPPLPPLPLPLTGEQFRQFSPTVLPADCHNEALDLSISNPWFDPVMLDMFHNNGDFPLLGGDVRETLDSYLLEGGL
ncbi:hypothetical protein BGW36DRAFT_160144 [Talaromyces proteolyticus]|uniref:Zn(2)-C6 fungal-type domain-containing protein n=1 Tax=Talaromyces proteolyticus TaxID=1131652 RepID=A0AAD4KQF4_9EURO|nr:uncharacterized protein BGW36DRAFT_160144 [Talaromyces proteolyticus]KAH8697046.1 hypothetical protein BGW36DRAFT_160144 [Talaromyces proteolyticus]